MKLASCHSSGALSSEVAVRFFENLWTTKFCQEYLKLLKNVKFCIPVQKTLNIVFRWTVTVFSNYIFVLEPF